MKDYEQIRVSRWVLDSVASGNDLPPMFKGTETVPRVLVPPEIRQELHANCSLSAFEMAEFPPDILASRIKDQLVHEIAKQLYDEVTVIQVSQNPEFGHVEYHVKVIVELPEREYTNE